MLCNISAECHEGRYPRYPPPGGTQVRVLPPGGYARSRYPPGGVPNPPRGGVPVILPFSPQGGTRTPPWTGTQIFYPPGGIPGHLPGGGTQVLSFPGGLPQIQVPPLGGYPDSVHQPPGGVTKTEEYSLHVGRYARSCVHNTGPCFRFGRYQI